MDVVAMRRDLADAEISALRKLYPGEDIRVHRSAPQTAQEHLADCQHHGAKLVFLPHEQPIPSLAMQAGVKHLILKDGRLMELVRVVPEFKPYEP